MGREELGCREKLNKTKQKTKLNKTKQDLIPDLMVLKAWAMSHKHWHHQEPCWKCKFRLYLEPTQSETGDDEPSNLSSATPTRGSDTC